MRHLLEENDEPRAAQLTHIKRAIAIYRALLAGGVVQRIDPPGPDGRTVALTIDLQPDFALNQPLSPFAVASLELLDRDSPTYALDALSVLESTLEDPRQVLSAQRNKARGEAVAAMKAEGIEYDERMELLEDVTYPQPLMELLDRRLRDLPQGAPVGRGLRAQAQVGGPGHVRAGHDVHRVRRSLPARPVRGPGAALPGRLLQGAQADRAGLDAHRGAARPHRVARRAGAPGRLVAAGRVGAARVARRWSRSRVSG